MAHWFVGASAMDHSVPDSRRPLKVRMDRRCKFKDSYAPPGLIGVERGPRSGGSLLDEEAIALSRDAQLELQQLRMEVQQLRFALRASANALQHAYAVLPPEAGSDPEAQRELIEALTHRLIEKDDELLSLNRICARHDEAVARLNGNVKVAVRRFARDNAGMLLQEVWVHWKASLEDKRLADQFKKELGNAKEAVAKRIARTVQGMFTANVAVHAKIVLETWTSVARAERERRTHQLRMEERKQKALVRWRAGDDHTLKTVVWSSWRNIYQEAKRVRELDKERKEHLRAAKELRKESMQRTALALASKNDDVFDSCANRIVFQAWRGLVEDIRARKVAEDEAARAAAAEERRKSNLNANLKLLLNKEAIGQLGALFDVWRNSWQEAKHHMEIERLKTLHALFSSWHTVALNNQRNRELDKIKKEQDELRIKHEQAVTKQRKSRVAFVTLTTQADGSNASMLVTLVWSAWREIQAEAARQREIEKQKEEWQLEWEKRQLEQKEWQLEQQKRQAIIAFSKTGGMGDQLLLQMVVSGWCRLVLDSMRERELDGAQRLWEEEQRQWEVERSQLAKEAQKANERHNDAHNRRKILFLMSMTDKDKGMLLQTSFQAWRRCWNDAKIDQHRLSAELEIGRLKSQLKEAAAAAGIAEGKPVVPPKGRCWISKCLPCGKKAKVANQTSTHVGKKRPCCPCLPATKVAPAIGEGGQAALSKSDKSSPHREKGDVVATDPAATSAAAASADKKEKNMLSIRVLSATGLWKADVFGGKPNPFCTIEIQDGNGPLAKTEVKSNTSNPEWNHDCNIKGYVAGQAIVFKLWDRDNSKKDDYLGTAKVTSDLFLKPGGSGVLDLKLAEAGNGVDATLKVKIIVQD